jgi:type IV secretion system protein VirB4
MQLLPALSKDSAAAAREQPAGKHLPYARHVDDHTTETRDGLLLQVLQVRGLLFETADTDEINYRKQLRDAALQAIGSSRYAIYHHIVRREAEVALDADYRDDFSRRLDSEWRAKHSTRRLYVNDLFLTLVRRPLQGKVGSVDRLRQRFGKFVEQLDTTRYELQQLNQARDALMAAIGNYEPRLLGVYETNQGPCSEPLELLSYLFNGEMRPVLLPMQDIGHYLPYRRISFGEDAIELGRAGASPRQFVGLVSIKDYPGQTAPGMLDQLLRLPFELTVSQSFGFVERQAALSRMNLALRRMRSAEDEALSLRGELTEAKDNVAAGRAAFGEHHMTIAVRAGSPHEVDEAVAEVQASLADLGILSVREDIALEPAFWAQFPGNFKYIARRGLVSTSLSHGSRSASSNPSAIATPTAAKAAPPSTLTHPSNRLRVLSNMRNAMKNGPSASMRPVMICTTPSPPTAVSSNRILDPPSANVSKPAKGGGGY